MAKKIIAHLFALLSFLFLWYNSAAQTGDTIIPVLTNKWSAFGNAGKYDSAFYYAKELQLYVQNKYGELSRQNAFSYVVFGQTYEVFNDQRSAWQAYKKSTALFDTIVETDTTTVTNNLYRVALVHYGTICEALGANTEGLPYLLKCAGLAKKSGDIDTYSQALLSLAINSSYFGDYATAQLYYDILKQAAEALPKERKDYYKTCLYNNLSDIYGQTGNLQKSLTYIKQALQIFDVNKIETGDRFFIGLYIALLNNSAEGYKNLHNTDSAMLKCAEAENYLKNKKYDDLYAEVLQEKAGIFIEEKKYVQAIPLCRQSLRIMDTLASPDQLYDATVLNLARCYQQTEQYAAADSLYRKEIKELSSKGLTTSYNLQQSLIGLCRNLLYQDKNAEVADSLVKAASLALQVLNNNFVGMAEADQLQYSAVFDDIFNMLNSLLAKDKSIGDAIKSLAFTLQVKRKNMVLNNQAGLLSHLRASPDTAQANLYAAWLNTRRILAKQYSLAYADRSLNTDSLELVSETLEKQASAMGFGGSFANGGNIASKFLQQDKNAANIEFVRYNSITKKLGWEKVYYGAFVVKGGDTIPAFVPLCSEAALTKLMTDAKGNTISNKQLTQKFYTPGTAGAAALHGLLWQPLEKYLKGTTVINYSPAGLLANISFHALYNGENWLANNYTIHCFSSLAYNGNTQATAAAPKQISLWGNMDYNSGSYTIDTARGNGEGGTNTGFMNADGIKPAVQTKSMSKAPLQNFYTDELLAIKKVCAANGISHNDYENAAATEENFKRHSPTIQGVLHISTHGFYTPYNKKDAKAKLPGSFIAGNTNPLFRCGLAFAGVNHYWMMGVPLPGHDDGILTGYEVSQLDLHNVQLVTLSACETGLGDITATEGNLGLQRAFKLAGVKSLLVSLWQVPAKQTQQLLAKFYTYWLAGKKPAEALQLAETDMQQQRLPPYYWAGFVLVE